MLTPVVARLELLEACLRWANSMRLSTTRERAGLQRSIRAESLRV